jgi:hypothetical protein
MIIADGRLKGDEYEFEIESKKITDVELTQPVSVREEPAARIDRTRPPRDAELRRRKRSRSRKGVKKEPSNETKVV